MIDGRKGNDTALFFDHHIDAEDGSEVYVNLKTEQYGFESYANQDERFAILNIENVTIGQATHGHVIGDEKDNVIRFQAGFHTVEAGGGDDRIISEMLGNLGRQDVIVSRTTLRGGGGNDVIIGGTSDDQIWGNSGDDLIKGMRFNAYPLWWRWQ